VGEGRIHSPTAATFPTVGADAKNLEAISKAIDQHNQNCPFPASEVRMNPFEIERLGWEEIRGLPLVGDPELGTGRFRIVCGGEGNDEAIEEAEAISTPSEVEVPVGAPGGPRLPGEPAEPGELNG
jgi:hypothetical protein